MSRPLRLTRKWDVSSTAHCVSFGTDKLATKLTLRYLLVRRTTDVDTRSKLSLEQCRFSTSSVTLLWNGSVGHFGTLTYYYYYYHYYYTNILKPLD